MINEVVESMTKLTRNQTTKRKATPVRRTILQRSETIQASGVTPTYSERISKKKHEEVIGVEDSPNESEEASQAEEASYGEEAGNDEGASQDNQMDDRQRHYENPILLYLNEPVNTNLDLNLSKVSPCHLIIIFQGHPPPSKPQNIKSMMKLNQQTYEE